MVDERFARLERRLAQLEGELGGARARIAALEGATLRAGRTGRMARFAGTCAIGILVAMAVGIAAAAPSAQPLAAAAPFKVVSKGGQVIFSVDADGARFFHNGRPVAGMGWNDADKGAVLYTADDGGTTAQIGNVGENGAPSIRLYSSSFKPQASFDLTADGGAVRAYDPAGHPRAVMSVLSSGGSIEARTASGDPVAGLYQHSDGSGLVQVFDSGGTALGSLQVKDNRSAELAIVGSSPDRVARLGASQDGTQMTLRFFNGAKLMAGMGDSGDGGLLELFGKTGKKTVKAANTAYGGSLGVYGTDEQPKVVISTNDAGRGAIDILNDSGGPAVTMKATASAGYFALTNAAGVARVEAGVLDTDQGILRTYGPGGFDYIRGRK